MPDAPTPAPRGEDPAAASSPRLPWQSPRLDVIPLDCEISAYAPAGDEPLF